MVGELPDVDEPGLRKVAQIERALKKLAWDNPGSFVCITNPLEFHLEIYPRDPETIRFLARALHAFILSQGRTSAIFGPAARGGIASPLASELDKESTLVIMRKWPR